MFALNFIIISDIMHFYLLLLAGLTETLNLTLRGRFLTWDWISEILLQENSNSLNGT